MRASNKIQLISDRPPRRLASAGPVSPEGTRKDNLIEFLKSYTRLHTDDICAQRVDPSSLVAWVFVDGEWQVRRGIETQKDTKSWCQVYLTSMLGLDPIQYQRAKRELFTSNDGLTGVYRHKTRPAHALVYRPSRRLSTALTPAVAGGIELLMSNEQLPGVNGSATDLMHQPSRGLSTAAIAGITAGSAAAVAGAGGLAWKQYLKNKTQSAQDPSTPAIPDDLLQTSKNDSSIGTVGKLAIGGSALAATGNVVANVGNAAAGLANAASSVASGTVNVASSAVTGASNAISSVATATSNVIDAASNVAKTGYGAVTGGGAYVLNALQKNRVPAEGVSANTAGAGSTPNTPGGSGGGESPGIDPTTVDENKLDEEIVELIDEDEIKTDEPALEQTPSAKDQLELSGNVDAPTDRLELPGIVEPPTDQEYRLLTQTTEQPYDTHRLNYIGIDNNSEDFGRGGSSWENPMYQQLRDLSVRGAENYITNNVIPGLTVALLTSMLNVGRVGQLTLSG